MSVAAQMTTDFILVDTTNLPPLYAYHLEVHGPKRQELGRKLAQNIQTALNRDQQFWTWSFPHLISNVEHTANELQAICTSLWQTQPDLFRSLLAIAPVPDWNITPQNQADYAQKVVQGKRKWDLQAQLHPYRRRIGDVRIERTSATRAWAIQGRPALSIVIQSHAILTAGFGQITAKLDDIQDLVDVWVLPKGQTVKSQIVAIAGSMQDHRTRLLALSKVDTNQQAIAKAPDHEWIVTLKSGYDYPLSSLQPSLDLETMNKLGLDLPDVTAAFRLQPHQRREMVAAVARAIRKEHLDWVNSEKYPHFFITAQALGCSQKVCFGGGQIADHNKRTIMQNLRQYGVYQKAPQYAQNGMLTIGLIDARRQRLKTQCSRDIQTNLHHMGFTPRFLRPETIETISQATLEQAVDRLQTQSPDIILGLLPTKVPGSPSIYHRLKRLTIGRGIPSQMIYEHTLQNKYAANNVVMGILAKTGNTLFTLAQPLDFIDLIVGLDVARDRKQNSPGSINMTAIARVYTNNGQLFGYRLHDSVLEGETLTRPVLENLFPRSQFAQKRVIIHRDGPFRGQETAILREIARSLDSTFYCVEIRKQGAPRLYREDLTTGQIHSPKKGDILKLSDTQALLVSSLPPSPYKSGTPQPLHIQADPELGINRAIQSILALTLLHLGSVPQPRLPVSIHYSDIIGAFALKGIKPPNVDGQLPYWL